MDNRPLNDELLLAMAYFGSNIGSSSGSTGVNAYPQLSSKPKLNNVEILGDKTAHDYGLVESMQDIFDINATQYVLRDVHQSLRLNKDNNYAIIGTSVGLEVAEGSNSLRIMPDGRPVFGGTALQSWFDVIETSCVNTVKVAASDWSATTTSIDGIEYYVNVVNLTKVYEEHPDVNIDHAPSHQLPTQDEREAFTLVASTGYFVCNKTNNKMTCYSQDVPTSDFYVFIKGAK